MPKTFGRSVIFGPEFEGRRFLGYARLSGGATLLRLVLSIDCLFICYVGASMKLAATGFAPMRRVAWCQGPAYFKN